MNKKYMAILYMEHHVSLNHPRMSREKRAAQFAPFSALNGYENAIKEVENISEDKIELSEDTKAILDKKLHFIMDNNTKEPLNITYFKKDNNKETGHYINIFIKIKKIDPLYKTLILEDNQVISIEDIKAISSPIFAQIEEY